MSHADDMVDAYIDQTLSEADKSGLAQRVKDLERELDEYRNSIEEACKWIKRAQVCIHPESKLSASPDAWRYLNEAMWYLRDEDETQT